MIKIEELNLKKIYSSENNIRKYIKTKKESMK